MGIPQVFAIFIQVSQHYQEKTRNVNAYWLTKDISLNSNQRLAWSPDFYRVRVGERDHHERDREWMI